MNILQISEYLKGVPEQFLRKEANPSTTSGRYPAFLLISEMNRRNTMSKQFAGIAAQQNQPQETVADRVVRETSPEPTQIASLQGLKSPRTPYQEEPRGQETMGMPGVVRMYEGGRVSFQNTPGPFTVGRFAALQNRIQELRNISTSLSRRPSERQAAEEEIKKLEDFISTQNQDMTPNAYYNYIDPFDQSGGISPLMQQYDTKMEQVYQKELADQGIKTIDTPQKNVDANLNTNVNANVAPPPVVEKVEKESVEPVVIDTLGDTTEKESISVLESFNKNFGDILSKYKDLNVDATKVLGEGYSFLDKPDPETFLLERAKLRSNDFLKAYKDKLGTMREGVEKDKLMGINMGLLSLGLNMIATAGESGSSLGALIKDSAKAFNMSLPQFQSVMKDVRQANRELDKADLLLLEAESARQENDIKTFDSKTQEAEKSKVNAINKTLDANISIATANANRDSSAINAASNLVVAESNNKLKEILTDKKIRSTEGIAGARLTTQKEISADTIQGRLEGIKMTNEATIKAAGIRAKFAQDRAEESAYNSELTRLRKQIDGYKKDIIKYDGTPQAKKFIAAVNALEDEHDKLLADKQKRFGGKIPITKGDNQKNAIPYTELNN
jgi:hypothetical protein